MKRTALLVACLIWANSSSADTKLSIITTKGYVTFEAGENWPVLEMKTQMPATLTVLAVPNPAEESTSDSTNLMLQLFERGSEEERTLFDAPVKQYGATPPVPERYKGWTITRQEDHQGPTVYSLWDARRTGIADVSVRVRLIWPNLPNNPESYEKQMDQVLKKFLDSIGGGLGKYSPKEGEAFLRPDGTPNRDPSEN
jgi:hypothetical protein